MDAYTIAGLAGAVVLLLPYLVEATRWRRVPEMSTVVQVVLGTNGAAAAVRLSVEIFGGGENRFTPFTTDERVYLLLGAVALLLASMHIVTVAATRGAR